MMMIKSEVCVGFLLVLLPKNYSNGFVPTSSFLFSSSTYNTATVHLNANPNVNYSTTTSLSKQTRLFQSSNYESNELTKPNQRRALEVFRKVDTDGTGTITDDELTNMLRWLDIDATDEEASALFKYLDSDSDGEIDWMDFFPWYSETCENAKQIAFDFQSLLLSRRTVDQFDQTPVDDDVLRRAVECAIAAPNRSMSEPWRFIKIGKTTVQKFAELNKNMRKNMETDNGLSSSIDWSTIPGWCVVTTKLTPDNPDVELDDFKSTSCAVQNFMLSMWSEGIGTKWTSGPVQKTKEFAELCGVDLEKERVAGCIWYGFPYGGLVSADPKRRKKGVDDVLSFCP